MPSALTLILPKRSKTRDKGGGAKKYGRNLAKCARARYCARVGKPNGPGQPGQHPH